jgi:DNA-binding response OmpR family regulator
MENTLRVLAVAHNETTLRLCLLGLGIEGMDVAHAVDFETAVQSAVGRRPDVIVLDTTTPASGGLAVLRELRSHPATSGVPIVTLTDDVQSGGRLSGWVAGASASIAKPFSLDELSQTVRRFGHMSTTQLAAHRDDVLGRLRELV